MTKEEFNRKISLSTNIDNRNKLVKCCVWNIALYGLEMSILRKLEQSIWRALKCVAGGEWRRQNGQIK